MLCVIQRDCLISDFRKVYPIEADGAYLAIVHGTEIDDAVLHVGSGSPLSGTGNVGGHFPIGKLDTDRNIEVVQYLKGLEHGLFGIGVGAEPG